MSPDARKGAITRDAILALLSDPEVVKVSRAEDEPRLVEGDECVDLVKTRARGCDRCMRSRHCEVGMIEECSAAKRRLRTRLGRRARHPEDSAAP
jgi:hypothetical protein